MGEKTQQLDKWGHVTGKDWTTRQLAEAALISPGRIRQMVARGQIEYYNLAPRLNLIPYYVGVQFLESRKGE